VVFHVKVTITLAGQLAGDILQQAVNVVAVQESLVRQVRQTAKQETCALPYGPGLALALQSLSRLLQTAGSVLLFPRKEGSARLADGLGGFFLAQRSYGRLEGCNPPQPPKGQGHPAGQLGFERPRRREGLDDALAVAFPLGGRLPR
jgi:hypothetical protein